jgi:hypothetical protein
MEYRSKYKAEEIEAILDAKNNTGEGVDSNLDRLFVGQLQTKEVEVSENTTIKADEGFLGLKEVNVKVSGGGSASSVEYLDLTGLATLQLSYYATSSQELHLKMTMQGQEIAMVGPAAQLVSQCSSASSIYAKIDFDAPIIMVQGTMRQDTKVRDYILSKVSESELASLPRITEAEFYAV